MSDTIESKPPFTMEACWMLLQKKPEMDFLEYFSFEHLRDEELRELVEQAREAALYWILAEDKLEKMITKH